MEEFKTKDGTVLSIKKEMVNLDWKKYYRIFAVDEEGGEIAHINYSTQCNNACICLTSLDNKQFAGQGVENALISCFENDLKQKNVSFIEGKFNNKNASNLKAIYKSCGYKIEEEEENSFVVVKRIKPIKIKEENKKEHTN